MLGLIQTPAATAGSTSPPASGHPSLGRGMARRRFSSSSSGLPWRACSSRTPASLDRPASALVDTASSTSEDGDGGGR